VPPGWLTRVKPPHFRESKRSQVTQEVFPMRSQPVAVGLTLCEKLIVEEGTRHESLINTFPRWIIGPFPSVSPPFCVVCVLVDGEGTGTIEIAILQESTTDPIYEVQYSARFPDRLREMRALFRVKGCRFPAAGLYLATISVDGEWVAQKRFQVY
jgi:hypothetical protein